MHPPESSTVLALPRLDEPAGATALEERRRASAAAFSFRPDPRRLRDLLAEVDAKLDGCDGRQRRLIRLLIAEIVSRLLSTSSRVEIELAVERKQNSIRLDVWRADAGPCDFFENLDEAIFVDLASVWGRDRRRECGAWFEVL